MKSISVIAAFLVVSAAILYFSKPSDETCRNAAMTIVAGETLQVPGYSDPSKTALLADQAQPDKIIIKDKVLWKDILYVYPQSVRKIGSAYLGSFHPGKTSKEP